jgi:hypothetical protein
LTEPDALRKALISQARMTLRGSQPPLRCLENGACDRLFVAGYRPMRLTQVGPLLPVEPLGLQGRVSEDSVEKVLF